MGEAAELDGPVFERARLSRDARFDGKFFIAVKSTGIYCRPICPSPTCKPANVRYYSSAAAAAEAGFRPCLRCRPEAAPGSPAWLGTSAIVRRALRLIQDGILDEASVDLLARRVGIGPRHLHRLFVEHLGASPITVAQTRRLQFAKHLLDETRLPITQIALAAGYRSLRRFNDAFRTAYERAPRELRRRACASPAAPDGHEIVLRLAFRPPYDWAQVRAFLAARRVPGVERVDGRGYARTLATQGGHAVVCVRPLEPENALELRVSGAPPSDLFQIATTARRCFDLSADPARITLALKDDPLLGPLLRRHPGLRIPGVWDAFECAVRTLLDQGVSPSAGRTLAARVVTRVGRPIPGGDRLTRLFPSAVELADADLGGLDIAASRLAALRSLAQAVADGAVDLSGPADQAAAALEAVPGIGSWTAQYVALRALGEPDAFPAGDLVLRRMAGVRGRPSSASVLEARAEAWRPWRGYAAFHLWCAASEGASPATRISNGEDSAQTTLRPVGPSREPGPAGAGASAARRRS